MARAIWSGTISFGLLNVPVKLYSAVSRKTIRFKELRESDGSKVRHRRVAEGTDEEVSYDEIVKGYEITPDRFVILTRDELSALNPAKSRSIDIQDFVDIADIDPIYFESPYYLGPADGAEKAYSLLARAMESSGRAAIARFVLRSKESLAAVRANDGVLTMTTMRFADEVIAPSELEDVLPTEAPKVQKKEVDMAEKLIDSLASDWDPAQYRDEYREELLAMIERKAEGKDVIQSSSEEPEATKAPDLMAALEQSIAAVRGESPKAKKPAAKKSKAKASANGTSSSKKSPAKRAPSTRSKTKSKS